MGVIPTKHVKKLKSGDSTLCYADGVGWIRRRSYMALAKGWYGTTVANKKYLTKRTSLAAAGRYYGITQEELTMLALTYGQ